MFAIAGLAVVMVLSAVLYLLNRYTTLKLDVPLGRRFHVAMLCIFVFAALTGVMMAQEDPGIEIDFGIGDLATFFSFFNTMFAAILPIALLVAGLSAGVAFAFLVGRKLLEAFSSMARG